MRNWVTVLLVVSVLAAAGVRILSMAASLGMVAPVLGPTLLLPATVLPGPFAAMLWVVVDLVEGVVALVIAGRVLALAVAIHRQADAASRIVDAVWWLNALSAYYLFAVAAGILIIFHWNIPVPYWGMLLAGTAVAVAAVTTAGQLAARLDRGTTIRA